MKHRIGIHALGLAIPRRYIAMDDLARARGVDPAKYTQGLGAREMALPPTSPLVPWPGHAHGDQFRFVGVSNHQRQYASG